MKKVGSLGAVLNASAEEAEEKPLNAPPADKSEDLAQEIVEPRKSAIPQFVADVWSGKTYSVAKHYWLFLVVPNVIFTVIVFALEATSLSRDASTNAFLYDAFLVLVIGASAMFNCARYRRTGWSLVGVLVATIGLLASILRAFNPANDPAIEKEVASLDAHLSKIGQRDHFDAAVYDMSSGMMTFTLDLDQSQIVASDADVKQNILSDACDDLNGKYIYVKKLRFVYRSFGRRDSVIDARREECS